MVEACLVLLFNTNIFVFSFLLMEVANRNLGCLWVSVDMCCAADTMDSLLFIRSRHC